MFWLAAQDHTVPLSQSCLRVGGGLEDGEMGRWWPRLCYPDPESLRYSREPLDRKLALEFSWSPAEETQLGVVK